MTRFSKRWGIPQIQATLAGWVPLIVMLRDTMILLGGSEQMNGSDTHGRGRVGWYDSGRYIGESWVVECSICLSTTQIMP